MIGWRDILSGAAYCVRGAGDLLLPQLCGACEANDVEAAGLCAQCNVKLLALVAAGYCRRCGSSLGANVPEHYESCNFCPTTLPRYAQVIRLGAYGDPLRPLIRHIKYRRQETLCKRLGQLLATAAGARCERLDVVLSVPMHWRRRLARGYDHARILARSVARELSIPLGDELVRLRHTPPQAHLNRTRRIENVRGAFGVRRSAGVQGAHVLLVDDVTTTGATANEAARALLDAGAYSVNLAVLAKADPPVAYARRQEEP